jgi:hypothetical protein
MTTHQHTPDEERRIREATLDRTIEESFPASDPPSTDPNPDDDTILEEQPPADGAVTPTARADVSSRASADELAAWPLL